MILDINNDSFHGLPINEKQWKLLRAINSFVLLNGYMPVGSELARLHVFSQSTVTRWLRMFDEQGYITRGKGLRNGQITEKGLELLAEAAELDRKWQAYRSAVVSAKERHVQEYRW